MCIDIAPGFINLILEKPSFEVVHNLHTSAQTQCQHIKNDGSALDLLGCTQKLHIWGQNVATWNFFAQNTMLPTCCGSHLRRSCIEPTNVSHTLRPPPEQLRHDATNLDAFDDGPREWHSLHSATATTTFCHCSCMTVRLQHAGSVPTWGGTLPYSF